jgi:hypothetical protein
MQSWLLVLFQGITALGVLYGIWNTILARRETVAASREAAAHAQAAVTEIQHVAAKVEEVHVATNSLVSKAEAAADARGELRGIEIGEARAATAAEDQRNPPQT